MATVDSTALIVRPSPLIAVQDSQTRKRTTIEHLCKKFLLYKLLALNSGGLTATSFRQYKETCDRVLDAFRGHTFIDEITADHFLEFRYRFPSTWGTIMVGHHITRCRTLFKYAFDSGLIDKKIQFGPGFNKPTAKQYRSARRLRGSMMFEAAEIRQLLEVSSPMMRAMILLGVNCGFGTADIGRLPMSALDLEYGWVNFPRPKTEVDRRCALWPETILAIKNYLLQRPLLITGKAETVFVTRTGRRWADGEPGSSLTQKMRELIQRISLYRRGRNFYGLRRTFETIGGESLDQVAVDAIMGHVPPETDMAAVYRQRISDERLQIVTDYIRHWLFPDESVNYYKKLQAKAAAVFIEWESIPVLVPGSVRKTIKEMGIRQCEMARGIRVNAQGLNAALSRQTFTDYYETRIRLFMSQLAQGKPPMPLPKGDVPFFERPSDIPLSDDVRLALMNDPLMAEDLQLLAESLAAHRITGVWLARHWGYCYDSYRKMKSGKYRIPTAGANRLRELFGLPIVPVLNLPMMAPARPGEIHAPSYILALFDRNEFGPLELREILKFLRLKYRVSSRKVARWMGYSANHLNRTCSERCRVGFASRLRELFAPAEVVVEGGAQ